MFAHRQGGNGSSSTVYSNVQSQENLRLPPGVIQTLSSNPQYNGYEVNQNYQQQQQQQQQPPQQQQHQQQNNNNQNNNVQHSVYSNGPPTPQIHYPPRSPAPLQNISTSFSAPPQFSIEQAISRSLPPGPNNNSIPRYPSQPQPPPSFNSSREMQPPLPGYPYSRPPSRVYEGGASGGGQEGLMELQQQQQQQAGGMVRNATPGASSSGGSRGRGIGGSGSSEMGFENRVNARSLPPAKPLPEMDQKQHLQ